VGGGGHKRPGGRSALGRKKHGPVPVTIDKHGDELHPFVVCCSSVKLSSGGILRDLSPRAVKLPCVGAIIIIHTAWR